MHTLLIYFSHFSIEFFALLEVPAQLRNNLFTSCSRMKHFLSCFSFARVGRDQGDWKNPYIGGQGENTEIGREAKEREATSGPAASRQGQATG